MKIFAILALLIATNLTTYFIFSNNEKQPPILIDKPLLKPDVSHDAVKVVETSDSMAEPGFSSLAEVGQTILLMEESDLRDSLLEVLAAGWFNRDHLALARWLNEQNPEVDTDPLNAKFANLASEIDPEGAVEWAATVMRPKLREQAIRRAADDFQKYDPNGFQEFLDRGGRTARAVYSMGLAPRDDGSDLPVRYDIVEEPTESIAEILAKRTHLAGPSSRPNKVVLYPDSEGL